jgi:hypothetical protein
MAIKWEYIFGGISAIAGIAYLLKGDALPGNTVVNNVPALQDGGPTQSYTSPLGATTTNAPNVNGTAPGYLTRNFGPSHVQQKAGLSSGAIDSHGCGCESSCCAPDPCSPSRINKLGTATKTAKVAPSYLSESASNYATAANTPQPFHGNTNNYALHSTLNNYNNRINAESLVAATSSAPFGASVTMLPTVPNGYIN